MIKFLIDRTILLVLKLFGIATILFFIIQTLPADPAAVAAGPDARPEQIKQIRIDLGLDKPVIIQYLNYIKGLIRGDLGKSLITREKIIDELKQLKVNVKLITDGDVAGALLVSDEKYNVDIFLGIGGGPEGVLAASALDAFNCQFQGRFIFHKENEISRHSCFSRTPAHRQIFRIWW